jgi:predicted metal-binding membrane protein
MEGPQKLITVSLISVGAISWILSRIFEEEMMYSMGVTGYPLSLPIFVSIWTVGMAAMMFPAIVPMVLLYGRLVNSGSDKGTQQTIQESSKTHFSAKVMLFVSCYVAVWSMTGVALLLGWSGLMQMLGSSVGHSMNYVFSAVLIVSGIYQFTPIKTKCLGYCESPVSFFMRRWSAGTIGAIKMGIYHGIYCLGCCWPYFLLMVALGWMNVLWMALFAAIVFGEKIWSRGIWLARTTGIGFVIAGLLVSVGVIQISPMMHSMSSDTMSSGNMDTMSSGNMDTMSSGNMDRMK